jgi:hypothetical protein
MSKTLFGSMDTIDDIERATRDLRSTAYPDRDVDMIVKRRPDDGTPATLAGMSAAAKGAIAGGLLGGVAGLAASLSGLDIPAIAPILAAGSVVATLAGAGAGAIAGGLIGGLTELGTDNAPLSDGAWGATEDLKTRELRGDVPLDRM